MKIPFIAFFLLSFAIGSCNKTRQNNAIDLSGHYSILKDTLAAKSLAIYCRDKQLNPKKSIIFLTINNNSISKYIYITHTLNSLNYVSELPIFFTKVDGYLVFLYFGEEDSFGGKRLNKREAKIIANQNGIIENTEYINEHRIITRIIECDKSISITHGYADEFIDYIPCGYTINIKDGAGFYLKK